MIEPIEQRYELLCIGNAIMDLYANLDEGAAQRIRHFAAVQHIAPDTLAPILKSLSEYSLVSGGGAANAAKIAALMGLRTAFVGAVGPDRFGALFQKELSRAGVFTHIACKQAPTGIFAKLSLPDGSTRILVSPGAACDLTLSDSFIKAGLIEKAAVVLLDGYMLNRAAFLEEALRSGAVIAVDVGSADGAGHFAASIAAYRCSGPFILFMNEEEAAAFQAALGSTDTDMQTFFKRFTENAASIVVVKLAAKGALVYAGGLEYVVRTTPRAAQESTGAGDAFCAGFLAGYIHKYPLPQCAHLGNKAAALTLDSCGVQTDEQKAALFSRLLRVTP